MRLITTWGFAELHVVRIAALCLAGNTASRRAMHSAGFVLESGLAAYEEAKGVRHDTAVLGMVTPAPTDPRDHP
jgi:ribosomal-protein-alanine N-acetyltransferase